MNHQSQQNQPNTIGDMVNQILCQNSVTVEIANDIRITRSEYEAFRREFIIDALAGKRYGQAFCERFIDPTLRTASTLYYFSNRELCERWIEDNYLKD